MQATVTRWWWIRHAPVVGQDGRLYGRLDVDCDCSDAPLFRTLARRLPVEAVWIVTPLKRTQMTAAAIARHHPSPPPDFCVDAELVEQDFGHWQGMAYADLAAGPGDIWERFWRAPADETPPGGESFARLTARVAGRINSLTHQHAGRDIVCVGHGGPIRAALAHALGISPQQALRFAVDHCSLTRLDHIAEERSPGSWRVGTVNTRAQLPA